MSDRQFTLFELTVQEPTIQLGPRSLGSGSLGRRLGLTDDADAADSAPDSTETGGRDATETEADAADDDGSGRGLLGKALRLALLAAAAAAARRLLGDDGEGYDLDNVTDLGIVTGEDDVSRDADASDLDDGVDIEVTDDEADGGSLPTKAAVIGLVVVLALGLVASRLLGDDDELEELEALDDVTAEP